MRIIFSILKQLISPQTDYDSETTERDDNLTDSNQDNSECTTPTASQDSIALAELADEPEPPPVCCDVIM